MKLNRHRLWEFIKDFFAINLGMAIYSLGWAAFLLPYHITTGGMVGLFAILYYVTKFPISLAVMIANMGLLCFAYKPLGWKFVIKTAYAVIALSTFLEMGQHMMTDETGQLIQLMGEGQDSMACVLGAILNGIGIAIVFLSGGSTGGWDVIAALVNKYKNISLGRVMLFLGHSILLAHIPRLAHGGVWVRHFGCIFLCAGSRHQQCSSGYPVHHFYKETPRNQRANHPRNGSYCHFLECRRLFQSSRHQDSHYHRPQT